MQKLSLISLLEACQKPAKYENKHVDFQDIASNRDHIFILHYEFIMILESTNEFTFHLQYQLMKIQHEFL